MQKKLAIIGAGYVGLVSSACFADMGHKVINIEIDNEKVKNLNNGKIHIFEPGLEDLIKVNLNKNITFTSDIKYAIENSDIIFLAVGTPISDIDGGADLSYINQAVNSITPLLKDNTIIVVKSTVPVGTCARIRDSIKSQRNDINFHIVSNPEFLREGSAIFDFNEADRVITGVESDYAKTVMEELYFPLAKKGINIYFTSLESSEMIKYTANSFLAMKIAFINEIANLCEKTGASIEDVSYGIGLDKRIGKDFLKAGPGYGGSCFPKDTKALIKQAIDHNTSLSIIESVIKSNDLRAELMADKIGNIINSGEKKLAVFGITFKGNTDDIRYSPSIAIIEKLLKYDFHFNVYDPEGISNAKKYFSNNNKITWYNDPYEAVKKIDTLVILSEWEQFKGLDYSMIKVTKIIDLRNLLNSNYIKTLGIEYHKIG